MTFFMQWLKNAGRILASSALLAPSLLGSGINPFQDLLTVWSNKAFVHEQVLMPAPLRPFFIPLALAKEADPSWVAWCKRIEKLLHGLSLPESYHYVAPHYAPHLHATIGSMCAYMNTQRPLIFVTKTKVAGIKAIEALKLGGNYNALIFNKGFIERHTEQELKAVTAYELARIARRHSDKKKVNKIIWWTGLSASLAIVITWKIYKSAGSLENLKKGMWEIVKGNASFMVLSTLCGTLCGIGAELISASLSRKYQHEADMVAVKAFNGSASEFIEGLRNVENDEALFHQRLQFQHKEYYQYVATQIDDLKNSVHPYVTCFLKNELNLVRTGKTKKPAFVKKAGPFDSQCSFEERISYIHDHATAPTERTGGNQEPLA